MVGVKPYIIVDNHKISPIGWTSRPVVIPADRDGLEALEFGVVDRVTISREAREKYRCHQARTGLDPPALEDWSRKAPAVNLPLLTYSSKSLC
jgi:hypothetical protein